VPSVLRANTVPPLYLPPFSVVPYNLLLDTTKPVIGENASP
jgi:hypothetical protein